MSVDLKRLQQLAEPLGWTVGPVTNDPNAVHVYYPKGTPNYPYGGHAIIHITVCAAQLEAEYRKLAKSIEAKREQFLTELRLGYHVLGLKWEVMPGAKREVNRLMSIADELSVKELTMVEQLREKSAKWKDTNCIAYAFLADALIDLYERKEPR